MKIHIFNFYFNFNTLNKSRLFKKNKKVIQIPLKIDTKFCTNEKP